MRVIQLSSFSIRGEAFRTSKASDDWIQVGTTWRESQTTASEALNKRVFIATCDLTSANMHDRGQCDLGCPEPRSVVMYLN